MPKVRRSSAVSRSDSLNASACAASSYSGAWSDRAPSPLSCRRHRDWKAAGRGARSAVTRRRWRCSSSRRRPQQLRADLELFGLV
eukprot:5162144-Pleurochrysis_carterae.AAC.1